MPTVNPRISVTLQPQLAAILKRLSQLTGSSQSALIGDLLASSTEVFERMTAILEAAATLKEQGLQVTDEIRDGLKTAHDRLEQQLGLVLETYDVGTQPIIEAAEKLGLPPPKRQQPACAGSVAAGPGAPMSNRGVTPHQTRRKPSNTTPTVRG